MKNKLYDHVIEEDLIQITGQQSVLQKSRLHVEIGMDMFSDSQTRDGPRKLLDGSLQAEQKTADQEMFGDAHHSQNEPDQKNLHEDDVERSSEGRTG